MDHLAAQSVVESTDAALVSFNSRLAQSGVALRLERRGDRLGLRGPLPCRHGTGTSPVQRIALGQPADPSGLARAQAQLRDVLAQLQRGTFQWEQWGRRPIATGRPRECAVQTALESFEQAFFSDPRRRRNPAGSRTTWAAAYRPYLRRLAAEAERQKLNIDLPLLRNVLESYPAASRARQQCGIALAALARHQKLDRKSVV